MKRVHKLFVIAFFLLSVSEVDAQNDNLNQVLSNLSSDAAKSFIAPAVSGFGADINSSWVHRIVRPYKMSLDIEFTLVGMGTFFNDNNKTFSSSGSFRFNRDQATTLTSNISDQNARAAIINQIIVEDFQVGISGPTIVGSKNQNVMVAFPGKTFTYNSQSYTVPTQNIKLNVTGYLENLSILPVAAPQLSVGTLFGTSVTVRYLPNIKLNPNLDALNYFGIGFQHNPAVWMDVPLPVDFSVGFYTQTMKVGSVLKATGTSYSLNVGKNFWFGLFSIAPYASFAVEKSTVTVNYSHTYDTQAGPETVNISFDQDGDNTSRFILGTNFRLGVINLNVDYSFAKFNTVSAGLGFVIL